ncbi:ankyrin, partial [Mytilinidion resinicola]
MVQEKIVESVDGMFLLARLHTDSLLDKRTAKDVKSTLAKLSKAPAALDDAYRDALQRIRGQLDGDHELAKKVLSWITLAKRPLTTAEICCALAVEPGEEELDPENVLEVEDLVSVCAGLVVVDQEGAVIRLVHHTTQEYLEQIKDAWIPGAQLYMATTCLTYLSFSAFRSGSCSTHEKFEERLRQNKFLDYAATHWVKHARSVEAEVASLACSVLLHNGSLSCATQVLEVRRRASSEDIHEGTALHYAARYGLFRITQKLLPSLEDAYTNVVDAEDSWGRSALLLAAKYGHNRIAQLLVNKGANFNAQGGRSNALQWAAASGDKEIVKLLVNKGADVNAKGGFYGNALQAAAANGHKEIGELL